MRYLKIFTPLLTMLLFVGCAKKETFSNTKDKVGISRVIYFPIVSLKGDRYEYVAAGSAYTEEGVNSKVGDADVPFTTDGAVNTATAGVYTLTYTAANSDGFTSSVVRTVSVYSTDASAAANDFSGSYARNTNGSLAVWTKKAPGVYSVFNPGGAPGTNLTAIVFNPTGNVIKMPSQQTNDGNITTTSNEVYTPGSPSKYDWKIVSPGYGTALRSFTKQ
ncbi:MAG: immunoglobulin-like domain-containing protein [Chitinophagaceae bacterium]